MSLQSKYILYKANSVFANLIESSKDMFKIPLLNMNTKAFPEHNWRFGNPKAFYITIDDTDFIDKLRKKSGKYTHLLV